MKHQAIIFESVTLTMPSPSVDSGTSSGENSSPVNQEACTNDRSFIQELITYQNTGPNSQEERDKSEGDLALQDFNACCKLTPDPCDIQEAAFFADDIDQTPMWYNATITRGDSEASSLSLSNERVAQVASAPEPTALQSQDGKNARDNVNENLHNEEWSFPAHGSYGVSKNT